MSNCDKRNLDLLHEHKASNTDRIQQNNFNKFSINKKFLQIVRVAI